MPQQQRNGGEPQGHEHSGVEAVLVCHASGKEKGLLKR